MQMLSIEGKIEQAFSHLSVVKPRARAKKKNECQYN